MQRLLPSGELCGYVRSMLSLNSGRSVDGSRVRKLRSSLRPMEGFVESIVSVALAYIDHRAVVGVPCYQSLSCGVCVSSVRVVGIFDLEMSQILLRGRRMPPACRRATPFSCRRAYRRSCSRVSLRQSPHRRATFVADARGTHRIELTVVSQRRALPLPAMEKKSYRMGGKSL